MNIGENIQKLRIKANLTQAQLAEYIGVSQSAVYYWEKGKREPNTETIKKLVDIFHISLDELYGFEIDTTEERFRKACEWLENAGFELSAPNENDFFQKYCIDDPEYGTICKMDKIDIIDIIENCVNDANEIRDEIAIKFIRKSIFK